MLSNLWLIYSCTQPGDNLRSIKVLYPPRALHLSPNCERLQRSLFLPRSERRASPREESQRQCHPSFGNWRWRLETHQAQVWGNVAALLASSGWSGVCRVFCCVAFSVTSKSHWNPKMTLRTFVCFFHPKTLRLTTFCDVSKRPVFLVSFAWSQVEQAAKVEVNFEVKTAKLDQIWLLGENDFKWRFVVGLLFVDLWSFKVLICLESASLFMLPTPKECRGMSFKVLRKLFWYWYERRLSVQGFGNPFWAVASWVFWSPDRKVASFVEAMVAKQVPKDPDCWWMTGCCDPIELFESSHLPCHSAFVGGNEDSTESKSRIICRRSVSRSGGWESDTAGHWAKLRGEGGLQMFGTDEVSFLEMFGHLLRPWS